MPLTTRRVLSPVKKPTKMTGEETGQSEERAVFDDTGQAREQATT